MSNVVYCGAVPILACAWLSESQTLGVLLARHVEGYPPNPKHESVSQIMGELASRALSRGYLRKKLVGRRTSGDSFLADNVSWSDLRSVETYRWAVIFAVGSRSRPLLAIDLGAQSLRAVTHHTIRWGSGSGVILTTR